jgi:Mg2+ and Co2+ transporter CorA
VRAAPSPVTVGIQTNFSPANLITFFPKRESSPLEGTLFQQADLRNSVYNELNGDLTGRTDNALDLAAFIVLHAVTVLLDRSSHPDLEIFRIFEEAIGMLTENMTTSLKRFRTQTYRDLVSNLSSSLSDSDDLDPGAEPSENTKSIKRRYKHELERAQRENRENTSALLELRDMEDELTTLSRLFEAQEAVVRSMLATFTSPANSLAPLTPHGQGYLNLALRYLEGYRSTAGEMAKRVDTTRKDYEKLLEMAQRQAQVDDVRWSRIQTELASSQNLSVMIFTTFTVIFLPLSFFTGLFGMNTEEWQAEVPSLGFIGSISLPVSTFLIVGSLVAAFSERVQGWFFAVWRVWRRGVAWWKESLERVTPGVIEEKRRRRRAERERRVRREERRRRERRAYDFWGSVRERKGEGWEDERRGQGVDERRRRQRRMPG